MMMWGADFDFNSSSEIMEARRETMEVLGGARKQALGDTVSAEESVERAAVPVTILTGFLGAGKTTLLKRCLKGDHGLRIAVIENEFGDEKGIERLVAKDEEGASFELDDLFVELSNGCVCCAVKDDLVTTLEGLLERSNKFDLIVIEASGVADPGPLAGVFWLDEALESRLYLDGIITLVDLKNLVRHLEDPSKQAETGFINEAEKQIAYADRILLNKRDLVDDTRYEQVVERVKSINSMASFVATVYSNASFDFIFNLRSYAPSSKEESLSLLQKELLVGEKDHAGHNHEKGETSQNCEACTKPSRHDTSVKSVVVRTMKGPVEKRDLEAWLGTLLWGGSSEIFRVKGIVDVKDSPLVHILQGVHETFEVEATKKLWGNGEFVDRWTRIVFIGRDFDQAALQKSLEDLVHLPSVGSGADTSAQKE